MVHIPKTSILGWVRRWASGLRFPWLLAVVAAVFFADLLVPDVVPFADEILLGLLTVVLGAIRRRRPTDGEDGSASAR